MIKCIFLKLCVRLKSTNTIKCESIIYNFPNGVYLFYLVCRLVYKYEIYSGAPKIAVVSYPRYQKNKITMIIYGPFGYKTQIICI